ncbi:MAG TPA: TIGR03089 family protein [Cellulomonas sp.]
MPDSPVTSLHARLAHDARPKLTWYGDDGERVELSGPVLAQWVTKAANLLVEELDAGPGFRVLLDLPGHWRAVVWALGVWRVGACVVVAPGDLASDEGWGAAAPLPAHDEPVDAVDAVVTTSPSSFTGRRGVVAVALPALARSFPAPLPAGAVDGAAVLGYGDALGYVPPGDLRAPALVGPGGAAMHAGLVRADGPTGRVLLDAGREPLDVVLRQVLDVLAAGGSVVLVGGSFAEQLRADDERRGRLVATERIT